MNTNYINEIFITSVQFDNILKHFDDITRVFLKMFKIDVIK